MLSSPPILLPSPPSPPPPTFPLLPASSFFNESFTQDTYLFFLSGFVFYHSNLTLLAIPTSPSLTRTQKQQHSPIWEPFIFKHIFSLTFPCRGITDSLTFLPGNHLFRLSHQDQYNLLPCKVHHRKKHFRNKCVICQVQRKCLCLSNKSFIWQTCATCRTGSTLACGRASDFIWVQSGLVGDISTVIYSSIK